MTLTRCQANIIVSFDYLQVNYMQQEEVYKSVAKFDKYANFHKQGNPLNMYLEHNYHTPVKLNASCSLYLWFQGYFHNDIYHIMDLESGICCSNNQNYQNKMGSINYFNKCHSVDKLYYHQKCFLRYYAIKIVGA